MPASSLFTGFSSIVRGANPSTRGRSTASLIVGLHTLHLPTSNNRARFVMPIHTQHYRWRSIRPSSSLCPFHRFREHADHALPTIEYRWSFSFRWRMCPVQDGRWRLNTIYLACAARASDRWRSPTASTLFASSFQHRWRIRPNIVHRFLHRVHPSS